MQTQALTSAEDSETKIEWVFRWLLTIGMIVIGALHFTHPDVFVSIMPPYLPYHLELVWLSGAFEIAGGIGLATIRFRRIAALGLIALFIAVFPANLHMAINDVPFMGERVEPVALWLRLPLQVVYIYWAWHISRVTQRTVGTPTH